MTNIRISKNTTIEDYLSWRKEASEESKAKIANFLKERFLERYYYPMQGMDKNIRENYRKNHKNGFAIMALCCLMIESLESFEQGWETSDGKSEEAFRLFFSREDGLNPFRLYIQSFYKGVRCGILHMGETTKGWRLTRKPDAPLFNQSSKVINVDRFHNTLKTSLLNYIDRLIKSDWMDSAWINFFIRMDALVKECKLPTFYFAYGSNMKYREIRNKLNSVTRSPIKVSKGLLRDYTLKFNKRSSIDKQGRASIDYFKGSEVWGMVYELSEDEFKKLDELEGGYKRLEVEILMGEEKLIAYTYIAKNPVNTNIEPPEKYREKIIEGAKEIGLDEDYIEKIKTIPFS